MKKFKDGSKVTITHGSDCVHDKYMTGLVGQVVDVLYTDEDGDIWVNAHNTAHNARQKDSVCIEWKHGWDCELVEE